MFGCGAARALVAVISAIYWNYCIHRLGSACWRSAGSLIAIGTLTQHRRRDFRAVLGSSPVAYSDGAAHFLLERHGLGEVQFKRRADIWPRVAPTFVAMRERERGAAWDFANSLSQTSSGC